jgi:CRISPR-associated endonuclease/helicase Cas3
MAPPESDKRLLMECTMNGSQSNKEKTEALKAYENFEKNLERFANGETDMLILNEPDENYKEKTREYIAHIKDNQIHKLEDHLLNTAELAKKFASEFGNGDWAFLAGSLHDIGKYNPEFQNYIKLCNDWEDGDYENSNNKQKGPDHSTAGSLLAVERFKLIGRMISYLIAGHHAGLPNWYHDIGRGGDLETRLNSIILLEKIREYLPVNLCENLAMPTSKPVFEDPEFVHLWLRMLYSCLVDADFLDTESFMDKTNSKTRGAYNSLFDLKTLLDNHLQVLVEKSDKTKVNIIRKQVLAECREKASKNSGVFSLNVPTGGGKTLSAMSFALEHAVIHGKKRIIMAIPFTSIIEQTADVYKNIFGVDNVIEHHSNIDTDCETTRAKLASENWDAPIVVTTNVQLFESLFAAKSSKCRKLHNIANSVIILDEAQTIPSQYLKPIVSVLKGLVKHYNVTIVLCTATQPVLTGKIGSSCNKFDGFENIIEIINEPYILSENLRRVELVSDINDKVEWSVLAKELEKYDQVLCVVNTRNDCRNLHSFMPAGTIHLSALMCAEERSKIIDKLREKLKNSQPVRVISTQLVEAGVDIDFPVVYRALTGLDSIAQAAGRCNREGKLTGLGFVKVFNTEKPAPPGHLRKGQDATKELSSYTKLDFSPSIISEYFELFFSKVTSFDEKNIFDKLSNEKEARNMRIQFRTAAKEFQLIEESGYKSIIIWYDNGKVNSQHLIEDLKCLGPERYLLRKLQRFTVSVPEKELQFLLKNNLVEEIHGYWVQSCAGLYKEGLGLIGRDSSWNEEMYIN